MITELNVLFRTLWCIDSEGSFGVTWYTAVFILLHYPLNWFHGLSVSSSHCLLSCFQSVTPAFTLPLSLFHSLSFASDFLLVFLHSLSSCCIPPLLYPSLWSLRFVWTQTGSDVYVCVWLIWALSCMENSKSPLYIESIEGDKAGFPLSSSIDDVRLWAEKGCDILCALKWTPQDVWFGKTVTICDKIQERLVETLSCYEGVVHH